MPIGSIRRVLRQVKRIAFVVAIGALALVAGVIVFIHTAVGREAVRRVAEIEVAKQFTGGATIGRIEGSPFTTLVVRDVVIRAPDGSRAIAVGKLGVNVRLLPLLRHHVVVTELAVEDVDVRVGPDFGQLMKPSTEPDEDTGPAWEIDAPDVEIVRGHVAIDRGGEPIDLDGIAIGAGAHLAGLAKGGHAMVAATWRQRANAPIVVAAQVTDDGARVTSPGFAVTAGGVVVAGGGLAFDRGVDPATAPVQPGPDPVALPPTVAGRVVVIAPAARVTALVPRIVPPADAFAAIAIAPVGARESVDIAAAIGATPVTLAAIGDLAARSIEGTLATGEFDLGTLSGGGVNGTAAIASGRFSARMPEGEGLPIARLHAAGHAAISGAPGGVFAIAATSGGTRATADVSVIGPVQAFATVAVVTEGDALTIEHATLVAAARDVADDIRGSVSVVAAAHGQLAPVVDVAATATVIGKAMHAKALGFGDARIDVAVAKRGAVLSGDLGVVAHGIAADPRAPITDVTLAVHARPSHVTATVAANMLGLGAVTASAPTPGTPVVAPVGEKRDNAPASVKTAGWAGAGTTGTVKKPVAATAEGKATLAAAAPTAPATTGPASVRATLDIAAPAHLDDAAAWKAMGRDAIRAARVQLANIDLGRLAMLLDPTKYDHEDRFDRPAGTPPISGRLDGDVALTPTTATGSIDVRDVHSPKLRGIKRTDVHLALAQPSARTLAPTVTVAVAEVGTATARAQIALPAHLFDVPAWRRAGITAVRAASIDTTQIAFDPAFWDRFGIQSSLRGRAAVVVKADPGLGGIDMALTADGVRGTPIAEPVAIRAHVVIDGKATTAQLGMTTRNGANTLITLDGKLPLSLAELRALSPAEIKAVGARPISATLTLPKTNAKQLLEVFGHAEIQQGTLDGKITVAGTVAHPTLAAHITGDHLGVPPGPRGKPIQVLSQLVVDGAFDGTTGKVTVTGREDAGGTLDITVAASPSALANAKATIVAKKFDLGPLLAFAPGPAGGSRGTLDANLAVTGFDIRTAKVTGELHMRGARVPVAPTIGTLRDANIDIAVHPKTIDLAATGKLGAGTVKLGGTVDIDGVNLSGGKVTVALRKVSPIGAVEPVVDADVTATIARKGAQWRTDIVIDHGVVAITGKSGEAIKPADNPSDLVIARGGKLPPAAKAALKAARAAKAPAQPLLVATITLHTARVVSDEFRTTLEGKLAVTADADTIGVVGGISANAGDLTLFDRRYQVERANVRFDGTIDPILDVSIVHDFDDVTTTTGVRGRLSKPELVLASDPATYSQSELLGFLLGGEPGGDPNAGGARDKLTGAGESLIANQIGGYVKKALPFDIDVIRYEAAGVDSSAAITVGSWLTHSLFFAFRQHLDARPDENSGEGTLEYFLTKRIEVEGTAGDRNYDAIDFLWRRRF